MFCASYFAIGFAYSTAHSPLHDGHVRPGIGDNPKEADMTTLPLEGEQNWSGGHGDNHPEVKRHIRRMPTHTNPRTLENWEQGRAKPNAQAALLIRLVERYPGTVDRLASV